MVCVVKFLVLVAGLIVVAADDKAADAKKNKENKVEAKAKKEEEKEEAKAKKKEEELQKKAEKKADKKADEVKGKMKTKVDAGRRLEGRRLSDFTQAKEVDASMKQTIAQAANTTADKVQTSMVDSADTDAGRRLANGSVVTTSYTVRVANSAEAQRVHSALQATAAADMNVILQKQLVANNATGYTATVTDHTVSDLPTETAPCHDVSENDTKEVNAKCYKNILWAKTTGMKEHPEYYNKYVGLTADSSIFSFQCVLWRNNKDGTAKGDGHHCVEPCTANDASEWKCPNLVTDAGDSKAAAPEAKSGGMPGYAWVLIILGVCCGLPCLGLLCSAFICYEAVSFILDPICGGKKKGAEKKKRAVKKPTEAAPALAATPMPVYTTSVPMPVYHQAPTVTYAAPHIVQAQPVYAGSVSYAAPAVAYAAPASVSYADPGLVPYTGDVTVHHVDGHHSQHLMNVHQPHQAVITHHVDGQTSSLAMQ